MRLRIDTGAGTHEFDGAERPGFGGRPIPCHRCGVCCERWQPLLTPADAGRLARHLGLSVAAFHRAYTAPYPFSDEDRLLRQEDGRCVFLAYTVEPDGVRRSHCTVHAARPEVCRDWAAGLDKKECVQGLERFATTGGLIQLRDLYAEPDDRAAFEHVAGACGAIHAAP